MEEFDEDAGHYNYVLHEVKNGIDNRFIVNQQFIEFRDYREVAKLAVDIAKFLPFDDQQKQYYVVRGESKQPVKFFADFVENLLTTSKARLKPSRYKGLGEMN